MPKTIFVLLREDATCGKSRGVTFDVCGEFRVVDFEYWLLTELFLYRVESLLLFLGPMPGNLLLGEVMERMCVMTPPMVGSTWPRVRSTLESDCFPTLSQGTALSRLVVD